VRIAILETGTPPGDLAQGHGRYDAMVRDLLGNEHHYTTFPVFENELPAGPDAIEGYVITGASAGVHYGLPWIDDLARCEGTAKSVGDVLGIGSWRMRLAGPSRRRRRGVGLGLHRYVLRDRRLWMGNNAGVAVIASHQDQVTALPPVAAVIGAGDFTPNAMIDHRDGGYRFDATLNSPPPSRAT
jgi:GMP synthase-like glutamine amidotransferase